MKAAARTLIRAVMIAAAMAACMASCTQNNGDISPWFGYWRMTSLTEDGHPVEPGGGQWITWSFQNDIVFINTEGPHHTYADGIGTWSYDGSRRLVLDFTHGTGQGDREYMYRPPQVLKIPTDTPVSFEVESIRWSAITLRRTLDGGIAQQIILTKVY